MIDAFHTLTKLIKKYDNVCIMTHKNPDLDGLGASICLYKIVTSFKKECYIIDTEEPKDRSVLKMYEFLQQNKVEVKQKAEKKALQEISENTLLIILDVHKAEMVESKKILENCKHVIVLDHHIKGTNYIKETEFSYINSSISSVTEFMVYYLKYLNKTVESIIATIMITGIEIDTSNYKLKTTEKTYEAAAILTSMGANSILKQELLKETKEAYLKRSYFVDKSDMINENMALCMMDDSIYTPKDLAEIAEQLLQFDKVEASFTIGRLEKNVIGVSARSLGNVNVEEIMSILGGGGHLTDAAAQLANAKMEEVKNRIIEIVNQR
ncbi:MAG: hypothetical protein HFH09_02390 [Bacilli bacterium]|nr:hypothetical protein [Bacilli bacterium]